MVAMAQNSEAKLYQPPREHGSIPERKDFFKSNVSVLIFCSLY